MAQQVLTQFQESPDAWTRVPDILERASNPQSKVRQLQYIISVQATQYIASSTLGCRFWRSLSRRDGNPFQMDNGKVHSFPCLSLMSPRLIIYTGIRNFIVGITVKVSSDEATLRREKTYVNKLNLALVQVSGSSLDSASY